MRKQYLLATISLLACLTLSSVGSLACATSPYSAEVPLGDPLTYAVRDTNGVVEYWEGTSAENVTVGPRLVITINEISQTVFGYDPCITIEFVNRDAAQAVTYENQSGGMLAFNLLLNYGLFAFGFVAPTDSWEDLDELAMGIVNQDPDAFWSMNGTVVITSAGGERTYHFVQNADMGDQDTKLVYREADGLLLEAVTSFANYRLSIKLSSSLLDIPGPGLLEVIGISAIAAVALGLKKRTH
jgi:hypothetical protein